ncbi:MAG: PTS sugar transporter subunit IIA [Alphaproteobacteria bacterium]|jgi:PTS system nitrogen regulatory IIA component|nr:PTS sugar transporter subunit IIA [Alphaproteobacteria bacterium]
MGISDILSEDMILTEVEASSKRHLLEEISTYIARKEGIDKNTIFEAVLERENLGSTGYGNGVAFPHARINGLKHIMSVFVRLDKPLDYDALDGQPVDMVAFMISPENSGDDHLRTLAAFSRVLKNAEICESVRKAKGPHEIYVALQG